MRIYWIYFVFTFPISMYFADMLAEFQPMHDASLLTIAGLLNLAVAFCFTILHEIVEALDSL
jgi:hypothetical protein